MPDHKIIYITGFMGSGKTTAGKKLAAALHWSFIDLDAEIESLHAKSIQKIFSESGEEFFRKLESKVLHSLEIQNNTVISVGGGTPCFCGNMDFMKKRGLVVYLKMTPQQLKSRLSENSGGRPLLNGTDENNISEFIGGKLSEREKFYNQASIIIEGINLNIKALKKAINSATDHFQSF